MTPTTGLGYSQTLYRMLAYVGGKVLVSWDAPDSSIHVEGILRSGAEVNPDTTDTASEETYFAIGDSGGFLLARSDFLGAETIGRTLRIEVASISVYVEPME